MIRTFPIAADWPGTLATMARPTGDDRLADDLRELRRDGVDHLVCLMEEPELAEAGLAAEPEAAGAAGLVFTHLPIPDRGLPADVVAVGQLARQLLADLRAGRSVVVHCRGGIGRASMIAASVLVADDHDADRAFDAITFARGLRVPDTPEQQRWVADHTAWLRIAVSG